MRRMIELSVLGALALGAFVGTYLVYFEAGEDTAKARDDEGVALYVAQEDELQKVTWDTTDQTLVMERKKDDLGEYLWLTVTTRTETVPAPKPVLDDDTDESDTDESDTDAFAVPDPVIVEETMSFVGNTQAEDQWEKFAPFEADRRLEAGSVDAGELGFDEPHGTLTVERAAGSVEIVVGGMTYGDRSYYVQQGTDLYLLGKRALTKLDGSTSALQERALHPAEPGDVTRVVVTRDGVTRTFVHKNPNDKVEQFYADASTPDTRDDAATTLIPSMLRLAASDPVPAGELPEGLTEVLSLEVGTEERSWPITVLSDGGDPANYFAQAPYTRTDVELVRSQVEEILADIAPVMTPE